jgi:hypothetical protein
MFQLKGEAEFMKRCIRTAVMVLMLGIGGVSSEALAQPFTYQGKLTDVGAPANGLYDMQFQVFPLILGGLQIGVTDTNNGVSVTDGLFTTEVDAINGAAIGSELYLEIAVRRSGSGDPFTPLAGRTRITVSPLAQRSINDRWSPVNATTIRTDPGISNVLVNAASPVYADSILTLSRSTAGANTFSGMYVDGSNPGTLAYYGWATAGVSRAEALVSGVTGNFTLSVGGSTVLTANAAGLVGLGAVPSGPERLRVVGDTVGTGTMTASNFTYTSPRTKRMSVHGASFHAVVGTQAASLERGTLGTGFAAAVGSGGMMMSVSLPDGATVTRVTCYATDNMAEAMNVSLARTDHFSGFALVLSNIFTTGAAAGIRAFTDSAPTAHVVDNSTFSYYLLATSSDWAGQAASSVKAITIEYTVPGPD